jgi:hypothetical protein
MKNCAPEMPLDAVGRTPRPGNPLKSSDFWQALIITKRDLALKNRHRCFRASILEFAGFDVLFRRLSNA